MAAVGGGAADTVGGFGFHVELHVPVTVVKAPLQSSARIAVAGQPGADPDAAPEVLRHETIDDWIAAALEVGQQADHQLKKKDRMEIIKKTRLITSWNEREWTQKTWPTVTFNGTEWKQKT